MLTGGRRPSLVNRAAAIVRKVPAGEVALRIDEPAEVIGAAYDDPGLLVADGTDSSF